MSANEVDALLHAVTKRQEKVVADLNAFGDLVRRIEENFRGNAILDTKPMELC